MTVPLEEVHVDRDSERNLFRSMLAQDISAHVLLIQAGAGMGKTWLLQDFWREATGHPRALINLKRTTYAVADILEELVDELGGSRAFRHYKQVLNQDYARAGDLTIQDSRLRDVSVNVTLGGSDADLRARVLTEAFFDDVAERSMPRRTVALLFDTYDTASPDVKRWLGGRFLRLARELPYVVVVISGQSIPELGFGWDQCCISQRLSPLGREHVREYLRRVEAHYEDETVRVLYIVTKGIPYQVASLAAALKADEQRLSEGGVS